MPRVIVSDASTGGGPAGALSLDFLDERISVRELIRSRVYQEVRDYNARRPPVFNGLVQPTDAERVLNGYRLRAGRTIDWERQATVAVEAFERQGFFVFVDGSRSATWTTRSRSALTARCVSCA